MDAKTRIHVLINIVPKGVDRTGVTVRKKKSCHYLAFDEWKKEKYNKTFILFPSNKWNKSNKSMESLDMQTLV